MKGINQWLLILVLSILILPNQLNAQQKDRVFKPNHLNLELGGNGLIYSLNYERLLSESFTLRGGIGVTPGLILVEGTFFHIPVTVSYLAGGERSKFEIGLGATYFGGTDAEIFGLEAGDVSLVFVTGIIGYRYTSSTGFVFRIFFSPLYSSDTDPNLITSGGLSFGFTFK